MTSVDRPPEMMETPTEQQLELQSEGHAEGFFTAALQLRKQDLLVDMTVTLDQKDYKVHSILLAAVSSVFLQRLECGVQEGMNLDGVTTSSGWEAILNFAYTGDLEPTPIMAGDILDAAEALGVPRVAEICKAVLIGTENEDRLSPVEEKWKTLQRLEEMYNEGIGWDTELQAEGDTFRVHRLALACGCEFFHGMFTSGMKETQQAKIPLCTQFTVADLGLIISFAYSGVLRGGWDYIFEAAQAALQYQVSGILDLCLDLFRYKLTPETCLDVLSFARAYGLHDLENTTEKFILNSFVHVTKTPKFLDLPINQLVDFLSSDSLYILNELEAFQGAVRWLTADWIGRINCAEKVLHCIRFPLMSNRELKQVRKEEMMADPGHLYNLMVQSLASVPPGPSKMEQLPCRVRYPEKVIVISGGDTLTKNMATRSPCQDFWFTHRFLNGIGLVKQVEWRRLGYLPEKPRFRHAVVVKDNKMYLFGGKHYYGVRDTMCSVFRPCAPLPTPVCGHAACVLDGWIYITGGSDGSCRCQSSMIRYCPDGPPLLLAPMQEERAGHIMEVLDGRIYVAGGLRWRDGHGGYADQLACEVYSPDQDVWVTLHPLPQAHVIAASVVLNGELYVLGGYSHNTYRDTHLIHCYNPSHDRWVNLGTMPQAYADLKACILEVPSSYRQREPSIPDAPDLEVPPDASLDMPYQNSPSRC
ncbi:kelch-like protein 33 isoform X2 [Pantherophis guttatus]|uniref:Kelch-like protein 33 isoform X2 n=1 Tax=Pantherophis guttatus TaxID=94885 RepID=A0A6P9B870_PANGU|nr:kelch-like protein 33 isoform X2 [Pantherophis guttatus]